jgi:hypothetical protein
VAAKRGLEAMVERLVHRLRESGIPVEKSAPHRTERSVTFHLPLSALVESASRPQPRPSDSDLGTWWHDHTRYSISYEPFDDGSPGFALIDRQQDYVIWARPGDHGTMLFRSWQTAVRAAIAREER